jgi:hypothetical protein
VKPREIEVEVLPRGPTHRPLTSGEDPFIAFVTRLMDTAFVIPGTNIRFGLDPLIGLLPGIGASASAVVSIVLIALSARHGVPRLILARMAANVLVNSILDSIPIVGDALSIFYRSNAKNYELLHKYAGQRRAATWRDWAFVLALIAGLVFVVVLLIAGAAVLLSRLFAPRS